MKTRLLGLLFCAFFLGPHSELQAQAVGNSKTATVQDTNLMDLTDQERYQSETYVHEGLSQRQLKEECAKLEDPAACMGRGKTKFLGMDSNMVKALSKAYSMVVGALGVSGGGFKVDAKPDPDAPKTEAKTTDKAGKGKDAGKEKEEQTDYCAFIPMGTEAVAMFMQTSAQSQLNNLPTNQETVQRDTVYKAARSHEEVAKNSQISATGFTATVGCYAVLAAVKPGVMSNPSFWVKSAGSGLLASFFWSEVGKHKDYAKQLREIADRLPGAGDCNPITEKACYCAQPETMYDPQNCLPYLSQKKIAESSIRTSCVDQNLKDDPKCNCVQTDTCYSKEFLQMVNGTNFGKAFLETSDAKSALGLTNGQLISGTTTGATTGLNAAKSRMNNIASRAKGDSSPLSGAQKAELQAIESFGVPPALAQALASAPFDSNAQKNLATFQQRGRAAAQAATRVASYKNNILDFSGGRGINKGKSGGNNGPNIAALLNKAKGGKKGASDGNILKFAEEAQKNADITSHKDRDIFEIISRRYQVSGWQRLELN
jgi:hypothetical protein